MTKTRNPLLVISILFLIISACKTIQPQTESTSAPTQSSSIPQTEAGVPRVIVGDAKAAFDNGEAIIVDVRSAQAYEIGHVSGAISIPLGEFESNIASVPLDKNQWIITYCT